MKKDSGLLITKSSDDCNAQPVTITKKQDMHLGLCFSKAVVGDVEEVLSKNEQNKDFVLSLNLMDRPPRDYDEYQQHEMSTEYLLRRIIERNYGIQLLVTSSISHEGIIESFCFPWERFMHDPIIVAEKDLYSWYTHGGTSVSFKNRYTKNSEEIHRAIIVKYLGLFFFESGYRKYENEIEGAGYITYELNSLQLRKSGMLIPCALFPVASIIQLQLKPTKDIKIV